jgi:hypothetical protein
LTEPQEPALPPEDDDDYHLFVEEEGVVVSAEDLFDLPTAARSLPGMDPVDSAAAMAAFTEAEAEPEIAAKPAWTTRLRLPAALAAAGLFSFLVVGVVVRKRSHQPDEIVEGPPTVEVSVPEIPEPVETPAPVETPVTKTPVTETPVAVATEPPPEPVVPVKTVMPAIQRDGRERLDAIEVALAAGRRDFARIELGRLLLETDALPETEREETRAMAELWLAYIFQDAADEARGMPR